MALTPCVCVWRGTITPTGLWEYVEENSSDHLDAVRNAHTQFIMLHSNGALYLQEVLDGYRNIQYKQV